MRHLICAVVFLPLFLFGQNQECPARLKVDSLIKVSEAFSQEWALDTAMVIANQAEALARTECGPNSIAFSHTITCIGLIYYNQGDYQAAEKLYQQGLSIQKEKLGELDADYLNNYSRLAVIYDLQGAYTEADSAYQKVLRLYEKIDGRISKTYVNNLYNLSTMYETMGNYEEAEQLLLESLKLHEALPDRNEILYANNLQSIASLYTNLKQEKKAEYYFLRARDVYLANGGEDDYNYLYFANNLASFYNSHGRDSEALEMFAVAQQLVVKFLGEDHPHNGFVLNAMGTVYMDNNQFAEAQERFEAALKVLSPEDIDYGLIKLNLAKLYLHLSEYERSAAALQAAETSMTRWWPSDYYHRLDALRIRGDLAWLTQDTLGTSSAFEEYKAIHTDKMIAYSQYLTEKELLQYLPSNKQYRDVNLYIAHQLPSLISLCYDEALFYKGYVLQSSQKTRRLIQSNEQLQGDYEQLLSLHAELAERYALPITEQGDVAATEQALNALQKSLIRRSVPLARAWEQVSWRDVQAKLNPQEIAIEFVQYNVHNPLPTDTIYYAALLVSPHWPKPRLVRLCTQKQLDKLLITDPNQQYMVGPQRLALYEAIWQPIQQLIDSTLQAGDNYTIHYSNSGALHQLHLAAIPDPRGIPLGVHYHFRLLGSTRHLAVAEQTIFDEHNNQTALLYGGIDYQVDTITLTSRKGMEPPNPKVQSSITTLRNTTRDDNWPKLPWTEVEVNLAKEQLTEAGFEVELRLGKQATEDYLKQQLTLEGTSQASPRILHFATHAYFFPEETETANSSFAAATEPLIRSGLILAGADYAWQYGKPNRVENEDGILTAYELSQLPLQETELVVLSACETGRGTLVDSEGVFGLQRACKIAGARYLIMSLWEVPDFQTQAFMTDFYNNWLSKQMTIPDAFSATQSAMRQKFKEPRAWAGFVLME